MVGSSVELSPFNSAQEFFMRMPREPRMLLLGNMVIGGIQTGVSASDGPSGWNTIGQTAMQFFDPTRDPPALLAPGDRVRFTVLRIDA